jgi:hypothetical protein
MRNDFWKVWAMLFVFSIFWLGWCIKTSTPAEAYNVQNVRIVDTAVVPVNITEISGQPISARNDKYNRPEPALPVEVK